MKDNEQSETKMSDSETRSEFEVIPQTNQIAGKQAEVLHGLNNVLVSILLNAQLIEWKLPSYSSLRRNVHELSAAHGAQVGFWGN
jgi:hypothetical protein